MAVEFAPIADMDMFKLTRLQGQWERDYPKMTEMPGSPPSQFAPAGPPTVSFALGGGNLHRIWAISADDVLLLQTQNDRLILNWRRVNPNTKYPGYLGFLRAEFQRRWNSLTQFLSDNDMPAPIPTLVEFNYVNAVALELDDSLEGVVTVVQTPVEELPGEDRFTQFSLIREVVQSETDPYTTQITISGQPQPAPTGERQLFFNVVAKSLVGSRTDDPLAALDAAHALAIHSFARLVTKEKQDEWGREQ